MSKIPLDLSHQSAWLHNLQQKLLRIGCLVLLCISVVLLVSPQPAWAEQSAEQINQIARQATILIDGGEAGSGVIIQQDSSLITYVLTAKHVVAKSQQYLMLTPDQGRYQVEPEGIQLASGDIDLAILKFKSKSRFNVASIGQSKGLTGGQVIYVAGAPSSSPAIPIRTLLVPNGQVIGRGKQGQGYELIYTVPTQSGMSGGGIFDTNGKLVGIHGRGDRDTQTGGKTGYNLGILIETFLDSDLYATIRAAQAKPSPSPSPKPVEQPSLTPQPTVPARPTTVTQAAPTELQIASLQKAIERSQWFLCLGYGSLLASFGVMTLIFGTSRLVKAEGTWNEVIALLVGFSALAYVFKIDNLGWVTLGLIIAAVVALILDGLALPIITMGAMAFAASFTYKGYLECGLELLGLEKYVWIGIGGVMLASVGLYVLKPSRGRSVSRKISPATAITSFTALAIVFSLVIKFVFNAAEIPYVSRGIAKERMGNPTSALADYQAAIQLNPQDGAAYLGVGRIKYVNGSKQDALKVLDQAIQYQPRNEEAYYLRGLSRLDLGNVRSAIGDQTKAISLKSDFAEAYQGRGRAYLQLGENETAIADLNASLKYKANNAETYRYRGVAKSNLRDYQAALNDFNEALRLNPTKIAEIYANRAGAKSSLNDKKGALADYDKAIELSPQNGDFYFSRGTFKSYVLGDVKGSLSDYDKAFQLRSIEAYRFRLILLNISARSPDDKQSHENVISNCKVLLSLQPLASDHSMCGYVKFKFRDYKEALSDYNNALSLDPQYVPARRGRGEAKRELKDFKGALADFDEALRLSPKDSETLRYRGSLKFLNLNDLKGGLADFNEAIRLNPNDDGAYIGRGLVKFELKDNKGAITDFDTVLKLAPNNNETNAIVYVSRGRAKANLDDNEGALADFNKAVNINSKSSFVNDTGFYSSRGLVKYKLQDYEGAIADFNKSIDLGRKDKNIYFYRATARAAIGNYQDALKDFDEAIRLDTKDASGYYDRALVKYQLGDQVGAVADFKQAAALFKKAGNAEQENKAVDGYSILESGGQFIVTFR